MIFHKLHFELKESDQGNTLKHYITSKFQIYVIQLGDFRRKKILTEYLATAAGKAKEVREGPTYQSGIGLTANADYVQDKITDPIENSCDKTIVSNTQSHQIVYFDLETTGLRRDNPQIIQIAAECKNGEFNRYLR